MTHIIFIIIFILLLLPGIAGAFLPIPGLLYMLLVALIFGFIDGFQNILLWELGVLAGIAVLSTINDYLSGILGAKYGGAGKKSVLYGFIGMLIGILLFPPFGGLAGIFVGILLAEIFRHGNQGKAVRAATSSLNGSAIGMAITLLLSIVFIFLFVIFAVR